MSDDRQFKIRITTEADTAGAKSTGDELEKLGKSGKKAHDDIKDAAEHSEVSHRNLHLALRQMGPEFAHLGHLALGAFANPATAGILAVALAIGALKKHFDDLEEKATQTGENLFEAFQKFKESMHQATEEITASDTVFAQWYENLDRRTGEIVRRLDVIRGRLKESPEGMEEVVIEAALKEAHSREQAARLQSIPGQSEADARALKDLPRQIEAQKKRLSDANKEMTSSVPSTRTERIQEDMGPGRLQLVPLSSEEIAAEVSRRQEAVNKESKSLEDLVAKQDRLIKERDASAEAEKKAKAAADDYAAQVKELTDEQRKSLGKLFSPGGVTRLETAGALTRAGISPSSPVGHLMTDVLEGEQAVATGHRMDASQRNSTQILVGMMQRGGTNADQIYNLLVELKNVMATPDQRLEFLLKEIKALRAAVNAARST